MGQLAPEEVIGVPRGAEVAALPFKWSHLMKAGAQDRERTPTYERILIYSKTFMGFLNS